jgi:hypothetical protein
MNQKRIGTKSSAMAITLTVAILFVGCASFRAVHHKYVMRGSILLTSGNEVYLCIGSRDGAQVGQKFDVYKLVAQGVNQPGKGAVPSMTFRKERTGSIKITQIVNEHFARADIVNGTVQKDYVAELEFPFDCNTEKSK